MTGTVRVNIKWKSNLRSLNPKSFPSQYVILNIGFCSDRPTFLKKKVVFLNCRNFDSSDMLMTEVSSAYISFGEWQHTIYHDRGQTCKKHFSIFWYVVFDVQNLRLWISQNLKFSCPGIWEIGTFFSQTLPRNCISFTSDTPSTPHPSPKGDTLRSEDDIFKERFQLVESYRTFNFQRFNFFIFFLTYFQGMQPLWCLDLTTLEDVVMLSYCYNYNTL